MPSHRQTVALSPDNAVELSNLKESLQTGTPTKLSLTAKLTDIDAFSKWLANIPAGSIPKLSMPVSLKLLNHPDFLNLVKAIKNLSPEVLEFDFGGELQTHSDEIESKLITNVVPIVDFPVQIKAKKLAAFEREMIKNLQSKPKPCVAAHNPEEMEAESLPDQGKKIRLKALMETGANVNKDEFKQFVDVDIEFVEVVEQNVEIEENIQIEELVQLAAYEGELIDYNAFRSNSYRAIAKANFGEAPLDAAYELIQQELFANLPHGIKYLSPIAARHLAANLPHWAAMNKDNCAPFVLKETAKHEFVLDYEGDDNEENKPFALHQFSPYEEIEPYYDVVITPPDQDTAKLFFRDQHAIQKLSNLWIRHGDKGIIDLCNKLKALDNKHVNLSTFLVDNYLNHFAHWEPFYNESFFEALRKLDDYTPLQMSVLKRFLATTGASQHDLNKTLEAFDIFWLKYNKLCKENDKLLQALNITWSTPTGGQPAVYMQRLLTILENARNLPDQLQSLDGIVLNQHGAYYASRYEGFTEVHPAMGFDYHPDAPFNSQPFNRNFNLYRVNIEALEYEAKKSRAMICSGGQWVIPGLTKSQLMDPLSHFQDKISLQYYLDREEDLPVDYHLYHDCHSCGGGLIRNHFKDDITLPLTHKKFNRLAYRYIGQQLAGITVQSLNANLNSENMSEKLAKDIGGFRLCLLQTLLFVTSDRYKGSIKNAEHIEESSFQAIMKHTDPADFYKQKEVSETLACIKELQANHINFSDQEALFYQGLQKINVHLQLPPDKLLQFFFTRVAGLPERFKEHQAYHLLHGGNHPKKDAWVHWCEKAQNDFRARLHHYLLSNKPAALKFINLTGPLHTKKQGTFLYAFNTEAFFSEIPQIAQAYRDDLLSFSAQLANPALNLVPSDFSNTLKTTDEDVMRLKKIRDYVYQSTQGNPLQNYLHYTISRLIDSNTLFSYEQVLKVFEAVSLLQSPSGQLDTAAVHAILEKQGIPVCINIAKISTHNAQYVKHSLISMQIVLELGLPNISDEQLFAAYMEKAILLTQELDNLSIPELQERFTQVLPTCNLLVQAAVSVSLKLLLRTLLHKEISLIFEASHDKLPEFTEYWIEAIERLGDIQALNDFVDVEKMAGKVKPIALTLAAVMKNTAVIEHQKEIIELFSRLDFAQLDSEVLLYWFDLLSEMPQRDYMPLLAIMVKHPQLIYIKDTFKTLIHMLKKLNENDFPTTAMTAFYQRFAAAPATETTQCERLIAQLITQFSQNNNDPITALCLIEPGFTLPQAIIISEDSHRFNLHREPLANLYKKLQQTKQLDQFLQLNLNVDAKPMILKILALAYSGHRPADPTIDLLHVARQLQALNPDQLNALSTHYDATLTSIYCLSNGLSNLNKDELFSQFLDTIEKSPFGLRDLEAQFNTDEVERVINGSLDLVNNLPCSYMHRKRLAETFLLVNELGFTLPVYHNKPAKDLSNAEIRTFFAELKDNSKDYNNTQRRILALAILREAMYRATGQFAFSTQMISIIDCMLHEGDVIANIDTGQGKSLIDIMKAAFLYLESDRVDITTSTLVDAARDIENYSPFLSLLQIPFAKKPVHANTPLSEFCQKGINFSTFSQLGLRFSKAMAAEEIINPPSGRISLVLNESDYALLDDRAIKRLAVSPDMNITQKNPWIYDAINAFVSLESFKKGDTGADEDARRLRRYLISQAKLRGKSATFIKDIEKDTLITWIESAILVNYELRENFDYVILPVPGKVGQFFARILMGDGRPSPDSVFGKGIQQLIHAKLNQDKRFKTETGENAFEITPENRTIISTDNRTLINYYRSKNGFIWGSSGTVGSAREIGEQAAKYGFAFSKIEPHQQKQVREKPIVILKSKEMHYRHLAKELQKKRADKNTIPLVIFCENIDKAKDIYAYMTAKFGAENIQLNTGTHEADAEKELIKNAAKPGMCTITTTAIGRNTDIPYDKTTGLDIWFTSIDSTRLDMQKMGRTGRQGSPGEIACFLNQEDQNIKSEKEIAALREALDAAGKKEREYHEDLYKVIGFFLAELEKMPSAAFTLISKHDFIYRKWSGLSEQLELRYRELILKKEFDLSGFFNEATLQFTTLLQEAAPAYQPDNLVLDETVFQNATGYPFTKPVRLKKCTPPIDIVYQLFHKQTDAHPAKELTKSQEEAFLLELQTLFYNKNYTATPHTQFFNAFFESEASRDALKNLYQTFLQTFLSSTQPCSFIMRWLGFNTPLNNIANDKYYLVLFRAFASVDPENPIVDADEIKRIATAMIEEYLQNSWWISRDKREAAIQLQKEILSSDDLGNLIKAICDTQVAVAEKDIASNKNRYGDSRLQNTLSNILTMAASLGVQTNTNDLVPKLSLHLNKLTGNDPGNALDIETVKPMIKTTTSNARVLAKSLAKALQLSEAKTHSLPGMEGRPGPKM